MKYLIITLISIIIQCNTINNNEICITYKKEIPKKIWSYYSISNDVIKDSTAEYTDISKYINHSELYILNANGEWIKCNYIKPGEGGKIPAYTIYNNWLSFSSLNNNKFKAFIFINEKDKDKFSNF